MWAEPWIEQHEADIATLSELIIPEMIEGAIREGLIDPVGKDAAQLHEEFGRLVGELGAPEIELRVFVRPSHEESLLSEARRYVEMGQSRLAIVMFATWLEHRLNNMLVWGAQRRELSEQEIKRLLRGSNIEEKTGLTWKLVLNDDFPRDLAGLNTKRR